MTTLKVVDEKNVPGIWRQRIGYGSSDLACNLIWQMISLYLLYFYTDVMGLSAVAISFMFVVTRVIDGITDLLVGYCIDKTNTRWGKSRPYFLFGAVPFALFAVLAFSVPDISLSGKLIYAYVTYIGLSLTYTIVNIPMASILPSLTDDTNERTALSTSRKFFGFLGSTIVSYSALTLVGKFGGTDEALGFKVVMMLFAFIGCAIFLFTFSNVRERVEIKSENVTLFQTIKSLKENKPWKLFALNILFMWTGFFIQSSALIYYFSYNVGSKSLATTVATIMSIIPILANFLVPILAKRLGKRNLYITSAAVQFIGLGIILIANLNISLIIAGSIVSAFGYGIKESIYFSMQADPVDYGIWKTGINTTGTLNSVNGFLGKCAQAISGGLGGALLSWGGYIAKAEVQPASALVAIKIMYVYIPMALLICSMITMKFYDLDKQYPKIKADLDARKISEE
ncbi:sugar/Na+(H+) simporter [Clostridioides difficile]|uniref:MFS transporter n=1 Tax=Clostridioides difficile TaxID=1496 RepID=UPI000D1EEA03|nr:MFS transporter [Clostridioides difficile]UWD42575.1 MFS transporter [Clostridioides difficile]UWD46212.1 MFS transporter [Clostridioides difficile]VFF91820.1 sugar/Na+(H+) simporter [Clostridioides difficile]VIF61401.1 sugar/Na+(H+) simporter [Clostridioides difficile]HBE9436352.1 MFS transporter [Clostridioides difficile]